MRLNNLLKCLNKLCEHLNIKCVNKSQHAAQGKPVDKHFLFKQMITACGLFV